MTGQGDFPRDQAQEGAGGGWVGTQGKGCSYIHMLPYWGCVKDLLHGELMILYLLRHRPILGGICLLHDSVRVERNEHKKELM